MSGQAASYYQEGPPQGGYQMGGYQQGGYQQPPQNYQPPQGPPQGYEQQQQAQYGQAPPNYGQPFDPKGNSFQETFKVQKPKWNDIWASILLFLFAAGYVAVAGLTIEGFDRAKGRTGTDIHNGRSFGLNASVIILFAFVLVVAIVLSTAYLAVARIFPKQLIWVTGILNVCLGFATAIYMLYRRYWSGGIIFLLFAIFAAFCFYTWIPRIPFSSLMLQTVIKVSKSHGHVYMVSALGGIFALILSAFFSVTLVSIYQKYQPSSQNAPNPNCTNGSCSTGKVIGLIAFITFTTFWLSEVLKNVIHVTISGVYGSWYFAPNNFPKGATRGAFRRSMTYSFGSISFGSLVVAIINFLRQICSVAQQTSAQDGNIVGSIIFCIVGCLISLLDWAVQFVNRYAFSTIALYGQPYIAAAKQTWKLIKDRGIDALVNECLIGPVLSYGATFVAYACALTSYLYLVFVRPGYNSTGSFTPVVVAFSFLIGLQVGGIMTTPISSGIDALFVAMAYDPEVLMREHAGLYGEMISVYPHVQQAIHA